MDRQRCVREQWDLQGIDMEEVLSATDSEGRVCPETPVAHMTPHELGRLGEALAAVFLVRSGYELIEHSYRCPEGEADYVAYDPVEECVVLVEVKTRRCTRACGEGFPEEAVDGRKRHRYRRIASHYLMENYPVPAIRFDVVSLSITAGNQVDILQICGAFDWECDL